MNKRSIKEIIESYISEDASEEVRMTFDKWLTDGDFRQEKDEALAGIWENIPLTSGSTPEDSMSIIEDAEKIENIANHKKSRRKAVLLWIVSSVAACMAVIAAIGWDRSGADQKSQMCLVSSASAKGEFTLPDGSVVWLNKNSRLYYSDDLKGDERRVRLEGEGYFDVAKDARHPFVVDAGGMSIAVLGTRFTVSAYQDCPVEAYLEEGSIRAEVPGHDPVMLTPDQAVMYDAAGGRFLTYEETASDHTAWIDGKLEFVNKSLKDIIECLEHWYCVEISCNDIEAATAVRLSMTIRQESIEEICRAISTIADASYFIDTKGNVKISLNR